jgi:hypothetical protein
MRTLNSLFASYTPPLAVCCACSNCCLWLKTSYDRFNHEVENAQTFKCLVRSHKLSRIAHRNEVIIQMCVVSR